MQEIAAEADVAIGLLYYHFTDKQGLYAAGLQLLAEQMREQVARATSDPSRSSALERLLAGLKAQLEFLQEHPRLYDELNGNASQPKVKAIIERDHRERMALVSAALPIDVERSPGVEATLEGWLHFVEGVEIAWLQDRKLSAEEVCELCCEVLFASVRAAADFERKRRA